MTPNPERGANDEESSERGPAADIGDLEEAGNVEALLALARQFRDGTAEGGRDMARAFACYEAAARLGNPEALYATALFRMGTSAAAMDLKEAATALRKAADAGHGKSRVVLANMYELGFHFKADSEKADVWYRTVARAEGIQGSPDSMEYARKMAALGSVRHGLILEKDPEISDDERAQVLGPARLAGYGQFLKAQRPAVAPTGVPAIESPRITDVAPTPASAEPATESAVKVPPTNVRPNTQLPSARSRLAAWVYALVFLIAGYGAAFLTRAGIRAAIAQRQDLPLVLQRPEQVFAAVLLVGGILPAVFVYRFTTVVKAILAGVASAAVGFSLWGAPRTTLFTSRTDQAAVACAAIFALTLLVASVGDGVRHRR
jgi:hypothetical protein